MDKFNEGFRFRTETGNPSTCLYLTYLNNFFTIGSCFADNTGKKLHELKFNAVVNPFGTVYDPLSVHRLLKYALLNVVPADSTFVERDGIFFCDELHSSIHAESPEALSKKIYEIISNVHSRLIKADVFLITYGTAFIYSRKDTGKPVANCHKLHGQLFEKKLLSPEEVISSFSEIYALIRNINPQAKFLITVSPVRHTKDTLELNSVSKSVLRLAAHHLKDLPGVFYYPAFEIMNDDLRDYRYYASDLIHPNEQAVEYIWSHLKHFLFPAQTLELITRIEKINLSLAHRTFYLTSVSHKKFLEALNREMLDLNREVDFSRELESVQRKLNKI